MAVSFIVLASGTMPAPGITRTRIPMPAGNDTDTGKYKDKNPYASRGRYWHREKQRQESLCPLGSTQAPGNTKTRIPMPDGVNTGTGKNKDKNSYAQRGRHRHREIQRQEFLCLPGSAQAPGKTKTRIPVPAGNDTGTGKNKDKNSYACRE